MNSKNLKKRKSSIRSKIIIVIALVAAGLVGLAIWKNFFTSGPLPASISNKEEVAPQSTESEMPTPAVTSSPLSNWSGYLAHVYGFRFTSVEGRSKVPNVTCEAATRNVHGSYAAWVGFDGDSLVGATVEQIGFTASCSDVSNFVKAPAINGTTYYAWAAMYNAGHLDVLDLPIRPGDVIFSKVSYAKDRYNMQITNETVNQTVNKSYECQILDSQFSSPPCPRLSAEWIIERTGGSALAKFDDVLFYDNKVTTSTGKTLYPNQLEVGRVDMVQNGTKLAETSEFEGNGNFKIKWLASGVDGD